MANEEKSLLLEISGFLRETGMGPTTFGKKAARNSHLVERLLAGRTIEMATAAKVRAFIDERRRARHGYISHEGAAE